jgi:Tfp pilus assembly protein PilE
MKGKIIVIILAVLSSVVMFSSCNSSSEKVEKAEKNVVEAKNDLQAANEAYMADMSKYKKQTSDRIAANQKSINEFNKRIVTEKKQAKVADQKKIAELEAKNKDMEKRMDDYQADGKENWEAFKSEFGKDMDELGNAFANFFD